MESPRGFSLIELVVALAIGVTLMSTAVPAWQGVVASNRLSSAVNSMVTMLALTRSEAIKRGRRTTLCKSRDGQQCSPDTDYQGGWLVFTDHNANLSVDTDETLIRVFDGEAMGGLLVTGNSPVADYISYGPLGNTLRNSGAFQAGTLTFCHPPLEKSIIIRRNGRHRIEIGKC